VDRLKILIYWTNEEKMMKTIGLLGGMSWESSIEYYRIINQITRERLGGLHSAKSVMVSVDFAPIEQLQNENRWEDAARELIASSLQIQAAGADFLLIATNTMHKVYPEVQAAIDIPILHIADATGMKIKQLGLAKLGLLGTIYTMEEEFYSGRLSERFGFKVLIPNNVDRRLVNRVIFEELVLGKIMPESRAQFHRVINSLVKQGAEGIILGCTEIPMIVNADDFTIPIFDTTYIHAEMAVDIALGERELDISMNID
jgi:aspartate racemase